MGLGAVGCCGSPRHPGWGASFLPASQPPKSAGESASGTFQQPGLSHLPGLQGGRGRAESPLSCGPQQCRVFDLEMATPTVGGAGGAGGGSTRHAPCSALTPGQRCEQHFPCAVFLNVFNNPAMEALLFSISILYRRKPRLSNSSTEAR